jgi:Cu/Ag efflux pump CusA
VGGPGGNDKPVSISVRGDDLNKLTSIADKVENIVKLC